MAAVEGARASALGADHPLGRAARVGFVAAGFSLLLALHVPLCPFALVTHVPCPGCGLGRATLALLSGDLGAAIHAHPLAPVVSPIVIVALASSALRYVRRGVWTDAELLRAPLATRAACVVAAALVAVWVARFFGLFGGPVAV